MSSPVSVSPLSTSIFDALRDPVRQQILRQIEAEEPSILVIQSSYDVSKQSINYHLRNLRLQGLIEFTRHGKANRFHLTNWGHLALKALRLVEAEA